MGTATSFASPWKLWSVTFLISFYLLLRWLLQPWLIARKRTKLEHPSEDTFRDYSRRHTDGAAQETLIAFPRLDALPTKLLSVIIPAYNESARLPAMLQSTLAFLQQRVKEDPFFTYEILVVDDGSNDGTIKVAEDLIDQAGDDVVRICRLHCNQGKGAAIRKGMLRMRGEYGLMADADGATEIEDVSKLMDRLKAIETKRGRVDGQGGGVFGVAVGSRAHLETDAIAQRAWHRTIMMKVFHLCVALLCSRAIKDTQCGFKLFTRDSAFVLFETLHLEKWAFDIELVYLCGLLDIPMVEVPVHWREVDGSKLIQTKLDIITTSAGMLRDMICVRLCYMSGVWRVSTHAMSSVLSPRRKSDAMGRRSSSKKLL